MTLTEYNKISALRFSSMDAIDKKCQWDKFDFEVDLETRQARERWNQLIEAQTKDEIEMGF